MNSPLTWESTDESSINFRGIFFWILEVKEPEHKHMNSDSIYTYPSMKANTMNKITWNTFTIRKGNTYCNKNNTRVSDKSLLGSAILLTWELYYKNFFISHKFQPSFHLKMVLKYINIYPWAANYLHPKNKHL